MYTEFEVQAEIGHLDDFAMSVGATTAAEQPSRREHQEKQKNKLNDSSSHKRRRESGDEFIRQEKKLKSKETTPPVMAPPIGGTTADTPFHLQLLSLYVTLSPISQRHALSGICAEHLSPLILTYHSALQGVVLSYKNARLSENPEYWSHGGRSKPLARSIDEYAVSFIWVTAEFLVFRPQRKTWIEGWINLQNEGHIGLVCWNLFNASIERKQMPKGWKWKGTAKATANRMLKGHQASRDQDKETGKGLDPFESNVQHDEGYFVDDAGNKLSGTLRFRVKDIETSGNTDREKGFLSIEGTLLSKAAI